MENGELDQILSCLDTVNAQASCSFDIDEFLSHTQVCNDSLGLKEARTDSLGLTQACTHAHACKTVGPDNSHTHTCYHIHTQVVPAPSEFPSPSDDTAESVDNKCKKRPVGNREAVRKYREKKKARAASLEDEVVRLRALNQQLMKRLQGQALLEAKIAKLKCLLVDIRGRIEGEIGSFPYQKPPKSGDVYQYLVNASPGTYVMNPCNTQHNDQLHCLHPGSEHVALNGQSLSDCEFDTLQCLGNQNSGLKAPPGYDIGSGNDSSSVLAIHSKGIGEKEGRLQLQLVEELF